MFIPLQSQFMTSCHRMNTPVSNHASQDVKIPAGSIVAYVLCQPYSLYIVCYLKYICMQKKNHVFLFCWSLLLFHFICTNLHFKKRWLPGQGQSPAIDKLIQLLIILSYIAVFVCLMQGLTLYKNWQNFFPDKYQRIFYNIHPWCIIMCHKLKVSIWF